MLKEQVKIIRDTEEKAGEILQQGEEQAERILASLEDKLSRLAKTRQEMTEKATDKYRAEKDAEAVAGKKVLEREYHEKIESLEKEAGKKIDTASDKLWDELKKHISRL